MSAKFFYVFIILGIVFVLLIIYDIITGHTSGYTMSFDIVIALVLFYRGYRVYMSKKDQELM